MFLALGYMLQQRTAQAAYPWAACDAASDDSKQLEHVNQGMQTHP